MTDHPWLSALFGDAETAEAFTAARTLERMIEFEMALTKALQKAGVIEASAAEDILAKCRAYTPDRAAIARAFARDGVPVPELVRQLKSHVGEPHADSLHRGATSQDLVDSALVQGLGSVNAILERRLSAVIAGLDRLLAVHGQVALMGRTRMQAAVPITVGDRVITWRDPLIRHRARLGEIEPRLMVLQFGGAAGTRHDLGDSGLQVSRHLAEELGLAHADKCWHVMRDGIAEYASWLSLVTGSLGKLGQDVSLMSQNDVNEIALSQGGVSSAMPHKQNPVLAETLVTLARFNAVQVSAIHLALIHEQERSGAAWSLEWLVLPQMAVATGAALARAQTLVDSIVRIGTDSKS